MPEEATICCCVRTMLGAVAAAEVDKVDLIAMFCGLGDVKLT